MLKFFEPKTKIQKDRQIIRDTDMRMAKYSRRGLVSNFLIYILCLLIEQNFIREYPNLSLVLTGGLLLTTLVRGYFLFRFESIYPRAPTQWRNKYFLATLIGAVWWGVMLASVTLVMKMQGEAAFMWLYTVVFFSTTAHAFAPYQRFLSIYQFLAIVPAAICTFFIGDFVGIFYGAVLLLFYWILNHHCLLIAQNYWDRLETHHILTQKAESLEVEKRDTIASNQLTNDYLHLLAQRMREVLDEPIPTDSDDSVASVVVAKKRQEIEKIYRTVNDFSSTLNRGFAEEQKIFNVRHYLKYLVRGVVESAEKKGLELETALAPALPARLVGDPRLLSQMVIAMVRSCIQQTQSGVIFVEVEFVREFEASGTLHITVSRRATVEKRSFFQSEAKGITADLELLVAKGIAEAMKGKLEINESDTTRDGKDLRLRLPFNVAEVNAQPEYHRLRYKGRPVLLVHPNPRWLDHKRLDLDAMGFSVQTVVDYQKAFHALLDAVERGKAIECVIYYAAPGDELAVRFCNDLLANPELKYIHQLIVCSEIGQKFLQERAIQRSPVLHFLAKPAGIYELEICAAQIFEGLHEELEDDNDNVLWVGSGELLEHLHLSETLKMPVHHLSDVKLLPKVLESLRSSLVVIETLGEEELKMVEFIRVFEKKHNRDNLFTLVAVGNVGLRKTALEAGADHLIDIQTLHNGDAKELRYWAEGRHH